MTLSKVEQAERERHIVELREILPPGSTVHTILRHVSQSGMMRRISVLKFYVDEKGEIQDYYLDYKVAKALGWSLDRNKEGIRVGGVGMDMGFHLVYTLSRVLYRDGFMCIGDGCPSNDHTNGDRDYSPHLHLDGGYMLKQRWL